MPNPPPATGVLNKKIAGVKGKYLLAVGGVGAVGFVWWSRKQADAAPPTPADASTVDPNALAIDPNADTEGDQYLSDAYGDSGYNSPYGTSQGSTAEDQLLSTALGDLAGESTTTTTATSKAHPNDKAWAHSAISYLEKHGYTPALATKAIGSYLTGIGLTAKELSAVETAVANEGKPPSAAPKITHAAAPKKAKKTTHKKAVAKKNPVVTHANHK